MPHQAIQANDTGGMGWFEFEHASDLTERSEVRPQIQVQPEPAQPDTAPCFAKHALLHLASSKLSCWRLSRQERAVNFKSTAAPQHDGDAQHDGESAISFDFAPYTSLQRKLVVLDLAELTRAIFQKIQRILIASCINR